MTKKSFYQASIACFFAGLVGVIVLVRLIVNWYLPGLVPAPIVFGVAIILFLGFLMYIFTRLRRLLKDEDKVIRLAAFWQAVLRYIIAFDLCSFGIAKFFHLQLSTPMALLDNPFSSFDDAQLMWSFFGRSYAFAVIIGSIQIIGSLVLLFRRTRLFATIFLLPVMLNILLFDYLYNYVGDIKYYITIETLALLYLLFTEYDRLTVFFFKEQSEVPAVNMKSSIWKNIFRFSVIWLPLLLMITFHHFPRMYPDINGKYDVKSAVINNIPQNINAHSDSLLTRIYIDNEDLVFEFNSYQRRLIGRFLYNPVTNEMRAAWAHPANRHDTLVAKILPGKTFGTKILEGCLGKQTIRLNLLRVSKGY